MKPLISIIIPLYNKEATILSTLDSVFEQTFGAFEVIIVDDGSTDNGFELVSAIEDSRFTILQTENRGVSHARNYGVSHAKTDYVAFLDADDYWYPNHLQNLSLMIDKFPQGKWFASAYEIKHNKRFCLPMRSPLMAHGDDWMGEVDDFFANSMQDCLAWTSAVCMKKSFFEELGGFDLALRNMEDTDLWVRCALSSNIVFSTYATARYHLDGANHISQYDIYQQTVMNFDRYEDVENVSLKHYLDLNRYSIAMRFRLVSRNNIAQIYMDKLDSSNLSCLQQYILGMPNSLLRALYFLKRIVEIFSIRVRSN